MINLMSMLLEALFERHGSRAASEGTAYSILFRELQIEIGVTF
jgi:hypothetical protein